MLTAGLEPAWKFREVLSLLRLPNSAMRAEDNNRNPGTRTLTYGFGDHRAANYTKNLEVNDASED